MTFRKSSASYDRHKIKQALLALSYVDNEICFNMCYPKENLIYYFYPSPSKKGKWNVTQFKEQSNLFSGANLEATSENITKNSIVSMISYVVTRGAFLTFHDDTSSMSINISTLMKYLKILKRTFEK